MRQHQHEDHEGRVRGIRPDREERCWGGQGGGVSSPGSTEGSDVMRGNENRVQSVQTAQSYTFNHLKSTKENLLQEAPGC